MKTLTTFQAHEKTIKSMCIQNDKLITGSVDGDVKVWDMRDLTSPKEGDKRFTPNFLTVKSSLGIIREGQSSIMQFRVVEDTVYVLDTGAIRKFRI